MEKNSDDCRLMEEYLKKNKVNVNNPLIRGFLEDLTNRSYLMNYIRNSTNENRVIVDVAFKKFYFQVKFTNYLSQTIYFNAVNFDKRHRLNSKRNLLTLDKPLGDANSETVKDNHDTELPSINLTANDSPNIEKHIIDCDLYEAISHLTENQKKILSLAYVYGYNDSEIAKILNKSQQSVSKSHKRSLLQLRKLINERRMPNE